MRRIIEISTLTLIGLLLVSCGLIPAETDTPPTETLPTTPTEETPETTPTASPTPTLTPVPPTFTPTPSPPPPTATPPSTGTPTPSPTLAGPLYGLQVSYTIEETEEAPQGEKWIVVVTAVQNNSDEEVVIERESLTLIDERGERYPADDPSDETDPPLVGARLEAGGDLLGLVRFTTPEAAQAVTLEWCPDGPASCSEPLTAPIP